MAASRAIPNGTLPVSAANESATTCDTDPDVVPLGQRLRRIACIAIACRGGRVVPAEARLLRGHPRADSLRRVPGAGPRVGSNAVEAGCETVVQERCDRSGVYSTADVANTILALR